MKVYTNIKTVKEAWDILNECGLEYLLVGMSESFDLDGKKVLSKLLTEGKLVEFMTTITHDSNAIQFEQMSLSEVTAIAKSFFIDTTRGFGEFLGFQVKA